MLKSLSQVDVMARERRMGPEIEILIKLFARVPGLGPRSARRATLHLLKRPEALLAPLQGAMARALEVVRTCARCGNLDTTELCALCENPARNPHIICVVEDVSDLWALERTHVFKGTYHVLGGVLSAMDGVRPEDLRILPLLQRLSDEPIQEVIFALNATVEGQTTVHYIHECMTQAGLSPKITLLAHGVPVGGELDYLDEGTLSAALHARRDLAL